VPDPVTRDPDGCPRARGLDIPFDGEPGPWNAITDVPGVEVGYRTIVEGSGPLVTGSGPVRTGVTVVHPRGRARPLDPVRAGKFSFNGNGEMTGMLWVDEAGYFTGPVAITNTHSVGMAHHGLVRWLTGHPTFAAGRDIWLLPVVGETCDAHLNDMNGLHLKERHVIEACDSAGSGPLAEGNVGGGTGMVCYEFKGGTGTASRRVPGSETVYTVGVLVQANFGTRADLTIRGVPVGRHLTANTLWKTAPGSIIAVAATDAPLSSIQFQRVARRIALGVARTGTRGEDGSGDIFLAFGTHGSRHGEASAGAPPVHELHDTALDPLFLATVEATEEAIVNALVAATTMTGRDGHTVHGIDHDALMRVMRHYCR
jgi:D-aminopeptidase